jgi:hypothetical protein
MIQSEDTAEAQIRFWNEQEEMMLKEMRKEKGFLVYHKWRFIGGTLISSDRILHYPGWLFNKWESVRFDLAKQRELFIVRLQIVYLKFKIKHKS